MLIAARGVQGFSCAFMAASSLAIITSSFPPGPQLHRAIGLWAAMNGLGGAAGTLFGGIITQALSWRWVLLINPPIGIAAALVAWRVVSDRRRRDGRALASTSPGALTLTVGQMVLVYGVVQAGLRGWHAALGARSDHRRARAAGGVLRDRDARSPPIRCAVQGADEAAQGREHDRRAVQRRAVPDVVPQLALPAAGARACRRSMPG